jgi:hypothetical protein
MAALLTIAIHVIILSPLVLSVEPRGSRHSLSGNTVTNAQIADRGEFASTVVIVMDQSANAQRPSNAVDPFSIPTAQDLNPNVDLGKMTELSQLEVSDDEDSRQTVNQPIEPAERAITFAKYMGRLTSRIERSWIVPNKTLTTDFHCRVQILRDEVGTVTEVTLQDCDADLAIRLSVLQAIQKSSPLPVLSGDGAFSKTVTLDFQAEVDPTRARRTSVQPSADDS